MFIIKERYLEVPNFQNWTEGLYLVDAPCGTGKSYFVFHTLYPFAKENNKKLIVFSNRNALKRQQELQAEGTDIELITYQKLEYNQYLNGDWNVRRSVPDLMQELERYDYIVLDEAHYLFQDARFNRNTEVILDMIEWYRLSKVIIMLSATPDLLKLYFGDRIKETYEAEADYSYIKKAYCYTSKDAAYKILDSIPQNEKAVFFGDSKERLKELHRRYPDSAYLCAENETTSEAFEQITSTELFDCRFLFTTKVLDNGVNLPYQKGVYYPSTADKEKISVGAERQRRYRAVRKLRTEPTEEHLWEVVLLYAGVRFKTYSGLPFTYEIRKGRNGQYTKELWIDRREKSKSLAWSTVLLALGNIKEVGEVVERPKALGDIRGVTYIYGIFYRFGLIDVPEEVKEKKNDRGNKKQKKHQKI